MTAMTYPAETTPNYGLLKVHGADALKLLQGQFTCDVESVTKEQSSLCAHCNSQGRVITLFQLFKHADAYYLLLPKSMLEIEMKALKKYAVFYKVTISDASDELSTLTTTPADYFDVQKGIPTLFPETSEKFLPHDINLPALNAVSFDKGCFTGQEIIARMHYRGTLKKHMYSMSFTGKSPLPNAPVYNPTKEKVGVVVNADNSAALIIIDDINAKNNHLFLDEQCSIPLTLLT